MSKSVLRLITKHPVDASVLHQFAKAGATILDESSNDVTDSVLARDLYTHDAMVVFPDSETVLSIPRTHHRFDELREKFNGNVPVFESRSELLIPVWRRHARCEKLFGFLQARLPETGVKLIRARHDLIYGQWRPAQRVQRNECLDLFAALQLLDAADIGLRKALFGFETIEEFELELDAFYYAPDDKGRKRVCPPFVILDVLENMSGNTYFCKIGVWINAGGEHRLKELTISNEVMLEPTDLRKRLTQQLPVVIHKAKMGQLVAILATVAFEQKRARPWLQEEGWVRDTSGALIGCLAGKELITLDPRRTDEFEISVDAPTLAQNGTLEKWNAEVLASLKHSHVMLGAVQFALANMMLPLMPQAQGSIINFYGGAGRGKTLTLSAAASIFGNPTPPGRGNVSHGKPMIVTFSSTDKALLAMARAATLAPLFVDELGSNNFGTLDGFIYAISNGAGRNLADAVGGYIDTGSRPVFVITTGEQAALELITRNARQGVLDRAVDIHIGGNTSATPVSIQGDDDSATTLLPDDMQKRLAEGLESQYGTVAPAFARAVLSALTAGDLAKELRLLRERIATQLYLIRGQGADRVLDRLALAALAGAIAVRSGTFTAITEDEAFEAVLLCASAWASTRWSHVHALREALLIHGSFCDNDQDQGLYRHDDDHNGWPTVRIRKDIFEKIIAPLDSTVVSKRLAEDQLLHRSGNGRNTTDSGVPYYHIRTAWMGNFAAEWDDAAGCFSETVYVDEEVVPTTTPHDMEQAETAAF